MIGVIPAPEDCIVPPGWKRRHVKQCELCPGTFVRDVGSAVIFCPSCRGRMLAPPNMDSYRVELPNQNIVRRSYHLPRYERKPDRTRLCKGKFGDWQRRVRNAMQTQGPQTLTKIQEIIGCDTTMRAYHLMYDHGLSPVCLSKPQRQYTLREFYVLHQVYVSQPNLS